MMRRLAAAASRRAVAAAAPSDAPTAAAAARRGLRWASFDDAAAPPPELEAADILVKGRFLLEDEGGEEQPQQGSVRAGTGTVHRYPRPPPQGSQTREAQELQQLLEGQTKDTAAIVLLEKLLNRNRHKEVVDLYAYLRQTHGWRWAAPAVELSTRSMNAVLRAIAKDERKSVQNRYQQLEVTLDKMENNEEHERTRVCNPDAFTYEIFFVFCGRHLPKLQRQDAVFDRLVRAAKRAELAGILLKAAALEQYAAAHAFLQRDGSKVFRTLESRKDVPVTAKLFKALLDLCVVQRNPQMLLRVLRHVEAQVLAFLDVDARAIVVGAACAADTSKATQSRVGSRVVLTTPNHLATCLQLCVEAEAPAETLYQVAMVYNRVFLKVQALYSSGAADNAAAVAVSAAAERRAVGKHPSVPDFGPGDDTVPYGFLHTQRYVGRTTAALRTRQGEEDGKPTRLQLELRALMRISDAALQSALGYVLQRREPASVRAFVALFNHVQLDLTKEGAHHFLSFVGLRQVALARAGDVSQLVLSFMLIARRRLLPLNRLPQEAGGIDWFRDSVAEVVRSPADLARLTEVVDKRLESKGNAGDHVVATSLRLLVVCGMLRVGDLDGALACVLKHGLGQMGFVVCLGAYTSRPHERRHETVVEAARTAGVQLSPHALELCVKLSCMGDDLDSALRWVAELTEAHADFALSAATYAHLMYSACRVLDVHLIEALFSELSLRRLSLPPSVLPKCAAALREADWRGDTVRRFEDLLAAYEDTLAGARRSAMEESLNRLSPMLFKEMQLRQKAHARGDAPVQHNGRKHR